MKALRKIANGGGRCLFLAAAMLSLWWLGRLSSGVRRWKSHFREDMPLDLLHRFLISPFIPLFIAAGALLLLSFTPYRKLIHRTLVFSVMLAALSSVFTPVGFGHDMSHCVINECSGQCGEIHLWVCVGITVAGLGGLSLVQVGATSRCEPGATPHSPQPSPMSPSPETQTPDSLRTPAPGGSG